jgi:hypothetical protein
MKTLTKSFKSRAAVAVVALAALTAGVAPAFAWGAGAPDSAYSVYDNDSASAPAPTLVRTKHRTHAYYDYAAPRGSYDYVAPQANRSDSYSNFAVGGWW